MTTFRTIDDVKWANRAAGLHFFDGGGMRYFDIRISGQLYGGCYFVTSERPSPWPGWPNARMYTVRQAFDDGHLSTYGGPYATWRQATAAARKAAAQLTAFRLAVLGDVADAAG
jgi:hypothetical protein